MAPLILGVLLGLSAIAASDTIQRTWGSVLYVYHGEKIPTLATTGSYDLTPWGAHTLGDAGSAIRDRYLHPPTNTTETYAPIYGLSTDDIDNTQLTITSTDDEFVTASALSFMAALYPPMHYLVWGQEYHLSNGTYIEYPLDGYQYPNIETVSYLDFNYIWTAGNMDCPTYSISKIQTMSSTEYNKQVTNTTDFYESLLTDGGGVFAALDPLLVTYNRAYDLYEYALFQYIHNSSIYHNMAFEDLEHLRALASQQQFQMNTPDQNGDLTTVAGKTLASKILAQFQQMSDSSGVSDKLTILFGSYEPFLAFFALSGLTSGSTTKSKFNSLPDHGSIMAFELFSYVDDDQQNESVPFPSTADLWVRFMFRNGTNETDGLVAYPLFSHGPSSIDMTWSDFVMNMGEFAMNEVADWCTACLSDNLFCAGIMENINGSQDEVVNGKKQLSPVIGGVIGATLTIGLFIICTLVLLLLGFRLDYHEKRKGTESNEAGGLGVLKRSVTGGGFKGAEKLASDTDLRLKGGAGVTVIRHERVGSWELNESPTDRKHSSLDKEIESGRQASYGRRSEDVGRENVDPFGDPVEAVDQV